MSNREQILKAFQEFLKDRPNLDEGLVRHATMFVEALPDGAPVPDFVVEDDGSIALDWMYKSKVLSICIYIDGRIGYICVDKDWVTGKVSAIPPVGQIPEPVLERLHWICDWTLDGGQDNG